MLFLARALLYPTATVVLFASMSCACWDSDQLRHAEIVAADGGVDAQPAHVEMAAADGGGKSQPDASLRLKPRDNDSEPLASCAFPEPPPLVMSTSSEAQQGVNGSFCAGMRGCNSNVCADRGVAPSRYSIVLPGDALVFSMPAGTLMGGGTACMPACPPTVRITETCKGKNRNVDRSLTAVPFIEDEPWKVMLAPGLYVLAVDSHFSGDNGTGGSMSAYFGLIVADQRERGTTTEPNAAIADCQKVTQPQGDADAGM